jgi:hypothetical protein
MLENEMAALSAAAVEAPAFASCIGDQRSCRHPPSVTDAGHDGIAGM